MVLGMGMVYFYLRDKLPFPADSLPGWKITLLIRRPSALALVIGGYVAHTYRCARRTTMARRDVRRISFRALSQPCRADFPGMVGDPRETLVFRCDNAT
jgi:hypothetical protein